MEFLVTRQPIFDYNEKLFAYKLLFQDMQESSYSTDDRDKAAYSVIANSLLLMNFDNLTSGKPVFIEFTANLLKEELPTVFLPDKVIVDLPEDLELDESALLKCLKLKKSGFLFSFENYNLHSKLDPFLMLADIVKINLKNVSVEEQKNIFKRLSALKVRFLAQEVDSVKRFKQAKANGYTYFQGNFFTKPIILHSRDIPVDKINYLRLLQAINQPEINFHETELIIKANISLSYKLLKYVNSSSFELRTDISSIRQALTILGEKEIKKWFSLIILNSIGAEKTDELVLTSCCRASFGELIAFKLKLDNKSSDIFLMGLLSLIDTLLNRPLDEILSELPISEDIKQALLGTENIYRDIYDLTLYYENANWNKFRYLAAKLQLDETQIPQLYLDSLERTNLLLGIINQS